MKLCYANPPLSELANVLTKIALGAARVILCTPDWEAYWRRLLDRMMVGRTELPNGPTYIPQDSQETVKMLVKQWFEPYGAPKQVHSDEDVRIRSDSGWHNRLLNALNVEVTTGVPYTHTSNSYCERPNRVVEQNLRILMKQERTKDWVRLVRWAVLTMNSQRSSSTGFTRHEVFHGGRPAWFFETHSPEDYKSPVGIGCNTSSLWLTRLGLT